MKTRVLPAIFASVLLVSPTLAETSSAPLQPGKPAGVKTAELGTSTLLAIGVLGVIVVGATLVVTNEGNQVSTATGTSP
jgi:hypothetical protein